MKRDITLNEINQGKKICSEESSKRMMRRERETSVEKANRLEKQKIQSSVAYQLLDEDDKKKRIVKISERRNKKKLSESSNFNHSLLLELNDDIRTKSNRDIINQTCTNAFRVENFFEYAEYECFCCSRLFYEEGIIKGNIAMNIYDELLNICSEVNQLNFLSEEISSELYFCHTCRSYIKNKKLPTLNKYNF